MTRARSLALVAVTAVTVRLAYVLAARPKVLPVSDGSTYHLLGHLIATGHGYLAPYDWFVLHRTRPTAEFGPVHPTVLALAHLVGARTVTAQQVWLGMLGAATAVLVAILAGRITDDGRLALAAGLVAAVDPLFLGSEGGLMSETTYTLLGVVLLLLVLRAAQDRDRWPIVAAGIALGLAVLTRGDGLLLVPFVVLPALGWRRWRAAVAVGLVVLGVVAPWVWRNEARFHRLILSNNVGSLVNGANCPEAYHGSFLGSWAFTCAYRTPLPGIDEGRNSVLLRQAGFRYAREHAGRLPVVVPARVGRGWSVWHPFGQARSEVSEGRVFPVQVVAVVLTWLLLPLFVVGVLDLRTKGRPVAPLVGMVVLVTLLLALTYGNTRFREIAEPSLIVGAVAGAQASITTGSIIGRRRVRRT